MEKPSWLKRTSQMLRFINLLNLAFETECNCEVCKQLRQLAYEMEEMQHGRKARRGEGRD